MYYTLSSSSGAGATLGFDRNVGFIAGGGLILMGGGIGSGGVYGLTRAASAAALAAR
jgi:hypothetical protein